MKQALLKYIHVFSAILSVALSITILGLDTTIMTESSYSGSISFSFFNTDIYYDIQIATIALDIIYVIGIAFSMLGTFVVKKFYLVITDVLIILINIPREGIAFKFFICINYTNYQIVQARACLTFISVVAIIVIHIVVTQTKDDPDDIGIKKSFIVFGASFLVLIGIIVLNIFTLINLDSELKKDINPKTIKIGYFTEYEIAQIEQYNFRKDSNFNKRIISNLNDVLESNNTQKAFSYCSYSYNSQGCTDYYFRILNVEIECNSESAKFYSDCITAHKMIIQIEYLDMINSYPTYNCTLVDKNASFLGACSGLVNHKLYLVQEFNNRVELGWDGFYRCEKPRVNLTEQPLKKNRS